MRAEELVTLVRFTDWLTKGTVQKLVLVITSQETNETLERWAFDLVTDTSIGPEDKVDKSEKVRVFLLVELTRPAVRLFVSRRHHLGMHLRMHPVPLPL